jgi:hypothetical protein
MLLEAPSLMPLLLPKLASNLADVHIKPKLQHRTLNFISTSISHTLKLVVFPSGHRTVSPLTAAMP